MHHATRDIKRDAISHRQTDKIAGSLDSYWFAHAERFADLVEAGEFPLYEETTNHRIVEDVDDGEEELWRVGEENVGDETGGVGGGQPGDNVGKGSQGSEAEVPEGGDGGGDVADVERGEGQAEENGCYKNNQTAPEMFE